MRTILIFTVGLFLCSCYSIPKYDLKKSMDNYEEFKSLEIPLYFDAGIYPFIYVNIQGNKIPVHVDIGDETGNFSFNEESLKSIKYKSVGKSNYSTGFNGIIKSNDYFNVNEIDIEGMKFRNIVCKKVNAKLPNYLMDIGTVGFNLENPETFGHHSESSSDTIPEVSRTLFRKFFGHLTSVFDEEFSDNKMFLVS